MQSLKPIPEQVFIGMNDRYPSHLLPPGMFQLIQNAILDQGRISKRKGTNPVAASLGAHAILGLSAFQPAGGTKYLIACLDGASNAQLYSWAGAGNFSTLGTANITAGAQMNFVQASNRLYGLNGTDVVTVDSSLTYTKNPATVPKGKYASWFHNYLFVANTSGFPNRLFWSTLGDSTQFDGSVATVAVGAGGVGYTVGDVLQLTNANGQAATVSVTAVSSGVITSVSLLTAGSGYTASTYATTLISTASTTGVGGSGGTVTVTINSTGSVNFVDINPNDGDEITGLAVFNDSLFVFKNNTIWSVTGFSGSSFSASTILGENTNNKIYGYGCPSQKSIVVTGKDMYYLSYLGNIPHFRSFVQTQFATTLEQGIVSYDIETTMQGLSANNLKMTAGIYDGKYIYWGVPDGSSTYNNLILVFEPTYKIKGKTMTHRSWVKWTGFNPSCFATSSIAGSNLIYFGDGNTTGNVNQLNYSNYADNGTAVSMDVRSRDYMVGPSNKGKWKYLWLFYETGSAGSLNINARIEKTINFANEYILSLAGNSPGLGSFILGTSTLGGANVSEVRVPLTQMTGFLFGLQFLETTANACVIDHYEIWVKPKPLRH